MTSARVQRELMKTIRQRQRQLNFIGHVMRRHGLENLAVTGKVNGRRGRSRRQKLKYLDSLHVDSLYTCLKDNRARQGLTGHVGLTLASQLVANVSLKRARHLNEKIENTNGFEQRGRVSEQDRPTYHVEFSSEKKSGHGEGDDSAGGQREIGVDDCPILALTNGRCTVEARPEQPQEDGTCTRIITMTTVGFAVAIAY